MAKTPLDAKGKDCESLCFKRDCLFDFVKLMSQEMVELTPQGMAELVPHEVVKLIPHEMAKLERLLMQGEG